MIRCILCLLFLLPVLVRGQSNPCGVKAVIVPGNDSVITVPTAVNFQSASINATDYKFFTPYANNINTPVNTGFGEGLTTVKLVAYNGACTDTAEVHYFFPGRFPAATDNPSRLYGIGSRMHSITDFIGVSAGGYLMAGNRNYSWYYGEQQQGLLIRTKPEGCVAWARKLIGTWMYTSDIKLVRESADGGFFITAEVDYKRFIAKLDVNGDLQWSESLTDASGYNLFTNGMEAMPDGGVLVTGIPYGGAKQVLIRLNSTGGIVWQKELVYYHNNSGAFQNIAIKNNFLYVCGNVNPNNTSYDGLLTKIDFNSGQTLWTKKYEQASGNMNLRQIISVDSTLLINIGAGTGLPNVPSFSGLMRIDTAGQVLLASAIGETYVPNPLMGPYNSAQTHLIQSGKTFYLVSAGTVSLSLQPGIGYSNRLVKYDSTYKAEWVEYQGGIGAPRFYFNAAAPKDGFAVAGEEYGYGTQAYSGAQMLSVKVIDSSGTNPAANCYYFRWPFVSAAIPITVQNTQWTSDLPSAFVASGVSIPLEPFYPEMRFKCPDYVDSCSYLKISGPRTICNINITHTYLTHKNKSCGQPAQWKVPANVQIISQSGSSLTVRYPAFGRYVIYATNTLSCVPVEDSIVVIAENKTPRLELGPDQQICPQNTTTLHAGSKYFTYEWQDGSTDSLLQVNQPGLYWVKVFDSCYNELRDTVTISLAPPIPFSIGANRTKCNNDTLRLEAPAGFMNYTWSPAYNINSANVRVAIVNPQIDTTYTIIAEKTPGCFAYDTISIAVYRSLPINLGRDTGICMGEKVVLDAGPGFQQYQWSNGEGSQTITGTTAGNYSVTGTTHEGCKSGDTIKLAVFNNPVVELGKDPTLCAGSVRLLQAGNFAGYQWQNGDTGPSFTVTSLGKYYVTVTDNNHCTGSDTLAITSLVAVPADFLPNDTIVCFYAKVDLKPVRSFSRYLWSNGAISASVTVNPTGMYWLQATDEHNCTGTDTVLIQPKDCLMGLYVPSAFTPNHDGKNDVFKPTLLGNIKQFEFAVYNRWGQRLFYSTTPGKGWDGLIAGSRQDANVFVWVCKYQLEGEEAKVARGTVTLIR